MHRVLRKHIDGKLGAGLRKVPFSVKSDHICVQSPSFSPLGHLEETFCELCLYSVLFLFLLRRLADVLVAFMTSLCVEVVDNAILSGSAVIIYHPILPA